MTIFAALLFQSFKPFNSLNPRFHHPRSRGAAEVRGNPTVKRRFCSGTEAPLHRRVS
jgi:hypothetical protein